MSESLNVIALRQARNGILFYNETHGYINSVNIFVYRSICLEHSSFDPTY